MSQTLSQEQIKAVISDFRNFLKLTWKHLNLPEPTPVQYDIANYLQSDKKRQIIQGYRGVGKSWITSAFVVWNLLRNPQMKILVVSASKQRSDDFSTFTMRLIKEMPILAHLIPEADQRQSKVAFDVAPARAAHAPSVKSLGITSQLTGSRANLIIADDVEVVNNSLTQDMREKLLSTVSEFEAILVPDDTKAKIVYLGTPQSIESIYNKLSERGYMRRIWTARYPSFEVIPNYNNELAPWIVSRLEQKPELVDRSVDPKRFSDRDLIERELSYGRSGFLLQFMLDTTLNDAERFPLKTSDLIVTSLDTDRGPSSISWSGAREHEIRELPCVGFSGDRFFSPRHVDRDWIAYEGSVMAIDPSGKGKDEMGYAIVNQLHGKLFVMDIGGLKGGYSEENLIKLAGIAKRFHVKEIVTETNYGGGMFDQLLRPILGTIYPCTINDEKSKHNTVQKERRIIDTLEPVLNQHRLIIDEALIKKDVKQLEEEANYSLLFQMTRITHDKGAIKHDDRLDALAMAVEYWIDSMSRDAKSAYGAYKDKLLDKELKKIADNLNGNIGYVLGRNNSDFNPNWLSA
jgi:hypothetical protein